MEGAIGEHSWLDTRELARELAGLLVGHQARHRPRKSDENAPCVVGFIGSAGLGKTETCILIATELEKLGRCASRVPLDGFLYSRSERQCRGATGYEHAGWRGALAEAKLFELLERKREIEIDSYMKLGGHGDVVRVSPAEFILLDGNYSVIGDVKHRLSLVVGFAAELETMRRLRFIRDTQPERGRSPQEASELWLAELPTLRSNILPEVEKADIVVEVGEDLRKRFHFQGERKPPSAPVG